MSFKNGGKSQRNLFNPLSFSSDKISVNNTNSQHYDNNSKEKIKLRKFAKELSSSILQTNDILLLPLKKNPSIYPYKEFPKPGAKLAYSNIASSNYHPVNSSSSQPNIFQQEKKQPQINININNININNYQIDSNYDNQFPNIFKPNSLTPSTQNKRGLNIKLQNQMKKIEFQKEHSHNNLLSIRKPFLVNDRITSPLNRNQKDRIIFLPSTKKKIEKDQNNNSSFINELEELLKNVNGKHPFKPLSDNPKDLPFELDIEPILSQNHQNQINKRSNGESYHKTSNSCYTERPQTSYGGVLMRRFKLKNNIRENSAKNNDDIANDNDINNKNVNNYE